MSRRPWTQAEYRAYRERFPYSDEQFIEAIKTMADDAEQQSNSFLRDRYLSWLTLRDQYGMFPPFVLRAALPYVIKTCNICGATALYRQGNEGRCRDHKHITTAGVLARRQREELRHVDFEEVERKKRVTDRLRDFHRRHNNQKRGSA